MTTHAICNNQSINQSINHLAMKYFAISYRHGIVHFKNMFFWDQCMCLS